MEIKETLPNYSCSSQRAPEMGVPSLLWSDLASQDAVLVACPITQLISASQPEFPRESLSGYAPLSLKVLQSFSQVSFLASSTVMGIVPVGAAMLLSLPALTLVPLQVCPLTVRGLCCPPSVHLRHCTEPVPHRRHPRGCSLRGSTVWRQESGDFLCYSEIIFLFVFNAFYIIFDRQILVKYLKSY